MKKGSFKSSVLSDEIESSDWTDSFNAMEIVTSTENAEVDEFFM